FLHPLIGHTHTVNFSCNLLVRQTSERVLFLDERRNAAARSCHQYRTAGITSGAYNHVWPKRFQDRSGFEITRNNLDGEEQVLQREPALKTADPQADMLVSGLRHARHFHSSHRADKQDLRFWIPLAKLIGNSQRREDMAPGSSAAYDQSICFLCVQIHVVMQPCSPSYCLRPSYLQHPSALRNHPFHPRSEERRVVTEWATRSRS